MVIITYYTRFALQFVLLILFKIFWLHRLRPQPAIVFERAPHVLVGNHRNALDPLAITGSLGFRDFFRLAPFAFMTANVFLPWYVRPLARLFGCFPAHPGITRLYGIEKSAYYLHRKHTVILFPEGRRVRPGTTHAAKRGVSVILEHTPEARLILCHIEWKSPMRPKFIHMAYPRSRKSTPKTPDAIMRAIYRL